MGFEHFDARVRRTPDAALHEHQLRFRMFANVDGEGLSAYPRAIDRSWMDCPSAPYPRAQVLGGVERVAVRARLSGS